MANAIPILTYHSLHAAGPDYSNDDHLALRSDLETIRDLGFRIAPLTEVAQYVSGTGAWWLDRGRWVALSFDDGVDWDYFDLDDDDLGYGKSFYTILKEHFAGQQVAAPLAVSFVIASPEARALLDRACIAGMKNWQDTWWKAATQTGVLAIGNHSWDHVHPGLPTVAQREQRKGSFYGIDTLRDAERQLRDAERYIRKCLGGASTGLFAYPYGQAPDYLVQEYLPRFAEDLGIHAAFSTEGDFATRGTARWSIPRFMHGDDWKSPDDLMRILRAANRPGQVACVPGSDESAVDTDERDRAKADLLLDAAVPLAPVVVRAQRRDGGIVAGSDDTAEEQMAQGLALDDIVCLEEVTNPQFFVGELFRRHFHSEVPSYPSHLVSFCRGLDHPMSVIGYMHALTRDDMVFCGGMVVDEVQRRLLPMEYRRLTRGPQGVMDFMLRATIRRSANAAAIWSYVGEPVIEASMLRAGFARTSHMHLLVKWNARIAEDERATRLAAVAAMGPFLWRAIMLRFLRSEMLATKTLFAA